MEEQKTISDALQSVNIALDNYDDIFSDFDPSPSSKRLLSTDFLNELKRRYMETPKGSISVTFTLPQALRSEKQEALIKKRIKDYFKARLKSIEKISQERLKKGAIRVTFGILLSLGLFAIPPGFQNITAAMISPLLWYLMWSGFESILEFSQKTRKQKQFIEKFLKAEYQFKNEENVLETVCNP